MNRKLERMKAAAARAGILCNPAKVRRENIIGT